VNVLRQYRPVWRHLRPHSRLFALVIAIGLASTVSSLAQPWLTKDLIDRALLQRDFRLLVWVSAAMLALSVVGFALGGLSAQLYTRLSAAVLFDMRLALYRHLQTLSPTFFARTKMGEIVSRLNNDIGEVQRVTADALLALLSNVLFFAGSVAVMLLLHPLLFAVSVALLPPGIYAVQRYQGRLSQDVGDLRARSADLGSFLIESFLGWRLIVASARETAEQLRFQGLNESFVRALLRMQWTSFFASAIPGALLTLSSAIVFLYGGWLVMHGELTLGALMAFLAYHGRLLSPVQSLMGIYSSLVTGAVSLGRVNDLFAVSPAVSESPGAQPLESICGHLELRDVTFRYDRDAVLEGASLTVPAGAVVALMGPSGSGKSTIIDLLTRFFDPESGRVALDGVDLRQLPLHQVRGQIAVLEQMPFLFHASIRDNLRFVSPDATNAQLEHAARQAQIHHFIASLPEGFDTIVGERGLSLSAGERQRLALARALLRDPRVLILDEPTSALDRETATNLRDTLREAFEGRTVLIITHRDDIAAMADRVYELRQGRIHEYASAHRHH
jgi:ATP-binding cassette subfamily B protein